VSAASYECMKDLTGAGPEPAPLFTLAHTVSERGRPGTHGGVGGAFADGGGDASPFYSGIVASAGGSMV